MKQRIAKLLLEKPEDQVVEVAGWVRTKRDVGEFSFLEINDGSILTNIQVVADKGLENYNTEIKQIGTGYSVIVEGILKESPAKGQAVEVHASSVRVIGEADPETYPLQKKRHIGGTIGEDIF